MTENGPLSKFPAGQPGEGLKTILSLLQGVKPGAGGPATAQPDQIAAELAYKLAQAAALAKDRKLLCEGIQALFLALSDITTALDGNPEGVNRQP
jgi:hypothetical protein